MYMYICMYIHMYICMHVCIYIYIHTHTHTHTHDIYIYNPVCMYVHVCMYVYTHTHTHASGCLFLYVHLFISPSFPPSLLLILGDYTQTNITNNKTELLSRPYLSLN